MAKIETPEDDYVLDVLALPWTPHPPSELVEMKIDMSWSEFDDFIDFLAGTLPEVKREIAISEYQARSSAQRANAELVRFLWRLRAVMARHFDPHGDVEDFQGYIALSEKADSIP